jgi:hypothetical protein
MGLNKTKWLMLAFAICFALLQALQPFIHAHLDTEHSTQYAGLHINLEHEELVSLDHDVTDDSMYATPHAQHTISVDSGIKHDIDLALLTNTVSFILFFICFAIIFKSVSNQFPQLTVVHHKLLRRQPQSVRAPPQF